MKPAVFVVIVNYRAPRLTAETVASLMACSDAERLEIVIVDNDSSPKSMKALREACPCCTLLASDKNCGFGAGCNIGIRYALEHDAEWLLLLNNDTEVYPDFLQPLLAAANEDKVFATPKILYAGDRRRVWYGGGFVDFNRGGFYHETDEARASVGRDVTFASGCCLLGSAGLFRKMGGFDEDYFLYYEDAAFCLKAQAGGCRIRYVPESVVLHKVSATTGANPKFAAYYGTRNRLAVLSRFGFSWRAFAFVLVTRALRMLTVVFRPSQRFVLLGIFDWLRGRMGCRNGLPRLRFPIVVNGVFVGRQRSGLERFAMETLRALDEMAPAGRFQLLVPRRADTTSLPAFKNIEIVRHGWLTGCLWEQVELARYARRHRRKVLSLVNTVPFWNADYACIHDVFYVTHAKEFSRSLKGVMAMAWHRLHYRAIAKRAEVVFTVSGYSAGQIADVLGVQKSRISVLGNGWEHMKRIESDESVFGRFPDLKRGDYFFTLGNRAPYKNMAWILAAAAAYPETTWVMTGARMQTAKVDDHVLPNVIYTGYLSDGEMKALMENCRMLVHPSLDEGFGIPPLEALSTGRPVLLSRMGALPEVYGDAAYWIDPSLAHGMDFYVDRRVEFKSREAEQVLIRHTWRNVADRLLEAIP